MVKQDYRVFKKAKIDGEDLKAFKLSKEGEIQNIDGSQMAASIWSIINYQETEYSTAHCH